MEITKEFLEKFAPCSSRWDNYLKHYSDWSGTLLEFMELDKISSEDKVWVFSRNIPELITEHKEAKTYSKDLKCVLIHLARRMSTIRYYRRGVK